MRERAARIFNCSLQIRKFSAYCLARDLHVAVRWVPSEFNVSDAASRLDEPEKQRKIHDACNFSRGRCDTHNEKQFRAKSAQVPCSVRFASPDDPEDPSVVCRPTVFHNRCDNRKEALPDVRANHVDAWKAAPTSKTGWGNGNKNRQIDSRRGDHSLQR